MLRDTDAALAKNCRDLGDACAQALAWFADNEKTVGFRKPGLDRAFKKNIVEARKLATAAERPMSVGVFGASQTGKSFLIGSFIAPKSNPVKVVFGDAANPVRLDFLSEINPVGGDETTGLVTRFSVRPRPAPSRDFPVALRLLTEGDLIKILANTFTLDLGRVAERPFDADRLTGLTRDAEVSAQKTEYPGLSVEAVLDLEDYIQEELEGHPLNSRDAFVADYWDTIERYAPLLPPPARARLLAPLWGDVPEFTDLYLELRQALDEVGHSTFVYASLDSIRDRAHGVLHVQTIYHLDPIDAAGTFAQDGIDRVRVMAENGRIADLRKAVVTALTAELCVTLESKPWPFFEHTDLLDFPGARGREDTTADKFLRGGDATKAQRRAYLYLRGKIAVLFDTYSANLDLNTMLLCSDDRNHEVRKLAELIQRWVGRTHGATPAERQGHKTSLFLCMTKSDLFFDEKQGASLEAIVGNRFRKDIDFFSSWTHAWTPDRPFNNVVFVRNPKFARRDLFTYEPKAEGMPDGTVTPETGIIPARVADVARFEQVFAGLDIVRKYVGEPEERIGATLAINDGGISFIAGRLAPTCDPDLKLNQIQPRARGLADRIGKALAEFHESGDIAKRIAERRQAMVQVLQRLSAAPAMIGQFIAVLETDEEAMAAVFLRVAKGSSDEPAAKPAFGVASSLSLPAGLILPGVPLPTATASTGKAHSFGRAAVERWLSQIEGAAQKPDFAASFAIGPAEFSTVVQELRIAAGRFGIADRIAERIIPVIQYHQRPDEHMHRVGMIAAQEINQLVDLLGRDRPDAANQGRTLFARPTTLPVGLPRLAQAPEEIDRVRGAALGEWLMGLLLLAEENAASSGGGVIDIEQNERLGRIIAVTAAMTGR